MSETVCHQCKAVNRDTARFCGECGAPLLQGVSARASGAPSASTPPPLSGETPRSKPVQAGLAPTSAPRVTPDAPPQPESPAATLLNRYRLDRELGRGGFGAVYQAYDLNLSRLCALKENLNPSADAHRQFSREASVLANLSHPNLPRVTDHFTIPGEGQYLVMDFVDGEDLAQAVARCGRLPVAQAVEWISQVAEALDYLHSRTPPVLHRDIKPANIRINSEGKAMLVDFGLVKVSDAAFKTTVGARAVTPGYAPPEQYGLGSTDSRTDIYALAATLYRLLSGQEPMESVQRAAGQEIPPVREFNPQVPLALSQAIERGMALDPAQRYPTAHAFRLDIRRAAGLDSAPTSASRPASPGADRRSSDAATQVLDDPLSRPAPAPRPATLPPSASRPPSATAPRAAPWLWLGGGGALLVLCLFAGLGLFLIARNALSDPTPSTRTTMLETTPTTPPPTARPAVTPTPDETWRSPDPSTLVYAAAGTPDTLDPAYGYEVNGLTVLQNIYETLIFFDRDRADQFVPQLALEVPSLENGGISPDGRTYTFKIRPNVLFHDGSPLTAEDVAFSFQRGLLQGGINTPQWMLAEPLLGNGVYDVSTLAGANFTGQADLLRKAPPVVLESICTKVTAAVTFDNVSSTVSFHLAQPWGPFLSVMANTWGSVQSKAWLVNNGAWNGDCRTWQDFYGRSAAELNQTPLGSQAMGTGPYMLDKWEEDNEVVLLANPHYWRTEPAWEGGPTGPARIPKVIIRYVGQAEERFQGLDEGIYDLVYLGTNPNYTTLNALSGLECARTDAECRPTANPHGRLVHIRGFALGQRLHDLFFNFSIDPKSTVLGSGKLNGKGIPANFFANVHVRRAFAACFNYNRFLKDAMGGEGLRAATVMPPNMLGYDAASPYYTYAPQRCEDELRQAVFAGSSVWEQGFTLVLPANENSAAQLAIANIFKDELEQINPKFKLTVKSMPPGDYSQLYNSAQVPYFITGWVEDIHDPHNWAYAYILGALGSRQGMPEEFLKPFRDLLRASIENADPDYRNQVYKQFNQLYYEQVPSVPMFQAIGHQYIQAWLKGFYNNPVMPGPYFYTFEKH